MNSWILDEIDREIAKLQQARALLSAATEKNGRGRPKKYVRVAKHSSPAKKQKTAMSLEGRARIAAAQRARWSKNKKAVE